MKTTIKPVQVWPHTAVSLEVTAASIAELGVGGRALATWALLTATGDKVQSGSVEFSGSEYDAWGDDDAYLVDVCLGKLGLVRG